MSTWTCRVAALGLAALGLAGCDEATGLPFAGDAGGSAGQSAPRMAQVALGGGEIVLAAPDGYCFDRSSVRRTPKGGFAVMARCDTLGVRGFYGVHPLAIVTVTTSPQDAGTPLPTPEDVARSAGSARMLDSARGKGLSLAQLSEGAQRLEGVSPRHWRGVFAVGRHLVAVSLYAPEGSAALGRDGARILSNLSARTQSASAQVAAGKTQAVKQ